MQLKRRYDLIPNLDETVKGYIKHERETLEAVIKARNSAQSAAQSAAADPGNPAAMQQLGQAEGALTGTLGRLFALAESYPDLKANANFTQLQTRITALESEIADRREFYNEAVTNYNTAIETVPTNLAAGWANARPRELFRVAAADTADVEVKLNV